MNAAELDITPKWFLLYYWLDLAKYQRHGIEWEIKS